VGEEARCTPSQTHVPSESEPLSEDAVAGSEAHAPVDHSKKITEKVPTDVWIRMRPTGPFAAGLSSYFTNGGRFVARTVVPFDNIYNDVTIQ
jgi:hypothetical protein